MRLPLSDEQREAFITAVDCGEVAEQAVLSIGTSVTGAGLDPSRDSFEAFYSQMCTKATGCAGVNPDYVRGLRSGDGYGYRTFLNNAWEAWPEFIDFAQAKLTERDAEIARLRKSLEHIRDLPFPQMDLPATTMHSIAHKALKGPEA
ncbi:hypothetical protein FOH24_07205 [Acetobacter tropicalis]|uniref:Uncharacterized protein n=1 Tax=Acetobacter tropicalis TaxID=104102 RepID=A0A094YGH7_9PROT|nr:hypothetical protein [Acetobacter tropicalis]KAA8387075.1 hypothetical protein FOH22_10550 [Acetobacter tropicalis]KAA8391420.1 hypothetical protein FOH24_07205 [Acetobacter tropicalis]KGB21130.1 hypothetical protein AtDm6_3125 [Acetobacter tropicalis]MBC9008755.1 hypothetical protein [Acetobacter tropicalis]MDO8171928.1 hypothetical protein [Acetobacter tropicalis]